MSKIVTQEQVAAHAAAKARLLNANKDTLVDVGGNPITVDEEPTEEAKYVDLRSTPPEEQFDIINTMLVKWLYEHDIINLKRELCVVPEVLERRGKWLYTTNSDNPAAFEWDGKVVLHFMY